MPAGARSTRSSISRASTDLASARSRSRRSTGRPATSSICCCFAPPSPRRDSETRSARDRASVTLRRGAHLNSRLGIAASPRNNALVGRGRIACGLALALGLASVAGVTGCFSPKVARCAVQCAAGDSCPPDLVCMADNFCHDSTEDALCGSPGDDSGIDPPDDANGPRPDAALIDAGPPRPPAAAGEVIVSEIMNEPCAGAPPPDCLNVDAEWFELHNTTGDPIELEGVRFVGDNSDENFTIDRSLIIPPRGHIVMAVEDDRDLNGDIAVDFVYPLEVLLLNTGPDQIELVVDL